MNNNKLKKIIAITGLLLLTGCSGFNRTVNDLNSWENEKEYCSHGARIWVLERGNSERINITSEVVGVCESTQEDNQE